MIWVNPLAEMISSADFPVLNISEKTVLAVFRLIVPALTMAINFAKVFRWYRDLSIDPSDLICLTQYFTQHPVGNGLRTELIVG